MAGEAVRADRGASGIHDASQTNLGLLTEIDLDTLALYCFTWSKWREPEEMVSPKGLIATAQSGYEAVSPHVTRAKNRLVELEAISIT
jgi:phage terminase small subunit